MQPSELSELPESPLGGSAGDRGEVLLALVVLGCQEVGCFIGGAGRRVGAAADEDPDRDHVIRLGCVGGERNGDSEPNPPTGYRRSARSVSYTHLTLPTNREV